MQIRIGPLINNFKAFVRKHFNNYHQFINDYNQFYDSLNQNYLKKLNYLDPKQKQTI